MDKQYSDDNPYAKLRLVSDPAFGADYGIGLRADTLKQVAISKADCWEEGYHHHAEEVAKLRAERDSWHMRWESSQEALAEVMAELRQVGDLLRFTDDDDDRPAIHLAQIARLSIDLTEPVSRALREEIAKLRAENEVLSRALGIEGDRVAELRYVAYGDDYSPEQVQGVIQKWLDKARQELEAEKQGDESKDAVL